MVPLSELWLPILLSAVFVFVVSSLIHMVLQYHKRDFRKLPNEDKVLEALRAQGVGPGDYMFPHCGSMKEMGSPEAQEKYRRGPVGTMTVRPSGVPGIGKSLVLWFLYSLLVGLFVGYIGALALPRGADYESVMRLVSTAAILGYAVYSIEASIWKGQGWGTTLKFVFDGVVYGLVTGGTFGWLWPQV